MDIQEKNKLRFQFLKIIYEATDGSRSQPVDGYEVGKELGIDRAASASIVDYLCEKGLLERSGAGIRVVITHDGVIEIEEALSEPERPTEHFPAFNIISIGSMNNSTIQQASAGATQYISGFNKEVVPDLKSFLAELKASIDKLNLTIEAQQEMIAEIQTAEIQANSPKPKTSIIKETLVTIGNLLKGAANEAIAPFLIEKVKLLLPLIG